MDKPITTIPHSILAIKEAAKKLDFSLEVYDLMGMGVEKREQLLRNLENALKPKRPLQDELI